MQRPRCCFLSYVFCQFARLHLTIVSESTNDNNYIASLKIWKLFCSLLPSTFSRLLVIVLVSSPLPPGSLSRLPMIRRVSSVSYIFNRLFYQLSAKAVHRLESFRSFDASKIVLLRITVANPPQYLRHLLYDRNCY